MLSSTPIDLEPYAAELEGLRDQVLGLDLDPNVEIYALDLVEVALRSRGAMPIEWKRTAIQNDGFGSVEYFARSNWAGDRSFMLQGYQVGASVCKDHFALGGIDV